jgi:Ca2+-binding RTX toxin-like protein
MTVNIYVPSGSYYGTGNSLKTEILGAENAAFLPGVVSSRSSSAFGALVTEQLRLDDTDPFQTNNRYIFEGRGILLNSISEASGTNDNIGLHGLAIYGTAGHVTQFVDVNGAFNVGASQGLSVFGSDGNYDVHPLENYRWKMSGMNWTDAQFLNAANALRNGNSTPFDSLWKSESFYFVGGSYADQFTGGNLADHIEGRSGNDTLSGQGGADSIFGGAGVDTIYGGTGNDSIYGDTSVAVANQDYSTAGGHVDYIYGGAGNDTIYGQDNIDILYGGDDNDRILGGLDSDLLYGGNGDDFLDGGSNGQAGDVLVGGAGNDVYVVNSIYDKSGEILATGARGKDTVLTSLTVFSLAGTAPSSFHVENLTFMTSAVGGGQRSGYGNEFDNILRGSINNSNTLYGFSGQDTLIGGNGADLLNGGIGQDFLYGGGNDDHLIGSAGDDVLHGGIGRDILDGGAGDNDVASYEAAYAGVTARLGNAALNTGEALGDTYLSIEHLYGSKFSDALYGDSGDNVIKGFGGSDGLNGLNGSDTLDGGAGNDFLEGGAGPDILLGSDGFDFATYIFAPTGVTANLANRFFNTGDAALDSYVSIEGLVGSTFGDNLTGDAKGNVLNGSLGNDTLTGGAGADAFAFDTGPNSTSNFDTITDFNVVDDSIWLLRTYGSYNQLKSGFLTVANFHIGSAAADANDFIVYNKTTGDIFYDGDGNGSFAATKFAHVAANTALTAADFFVI